MTQVIKAIPLYKVKEFKKEVENKYDDLACSCDEYALGKNEMINEVLEMLDELIESNATFNGTLEETVTEYADRCRECGREKVLDKIRAEIADLDDADYDYEGYYKAVTDALAIIDKYKAESEEL